MTLDGYCDHTSMTADDELHQHYADLLEGAGAILYGRITYHLMESYWPAVVKEPTGIQSTDDFAVAIEDIPKVLFSRTLNDTDPTIVGWRNVRLAKRGLKEEILQLKQQPGKDVFLGSPSMIVAATNLGLVDEYQLCIHPVIAGKGLPLFKTISESVVLKLVKTKAFGSGAIVAYYRPTNK